MSKKRVIIFDLDDTLYPEITYVHSGFLAVSEFLRESFGIFHESYKMMKNIEKKEGRGAVFDKMLSHYKLNSKSLVKMCIKIYRNHTPNISLDPKAKELLTHLNSKNIPLYIITDGNVNVQEKKLKALNLDRYIKKAFVTHRYGIKHAKPSPYCFNKISELERTEPKYITYIADNPHKDFVNIKSLGFKTVRVKQGMFRDVVLDKEYEADVHFDDMREVRIYIG